MSRRMFLGVLWGGILGWGLFALPSPAMAQRGGFGFSIGGGGYSRSSTRWHVGNYPSGAHWGVNVPLGDGSVRLGVGNTPYYPYYRNHYWYDRGYDYYSTPYDAPSRRYYSAAQRSAPTPPEPPPLPTAGQLARMSDEQLRRVLADAAKGYRYELDGFSTGDGWKRHFKLAEVLEHATQPQSGPPEGAARTMLDSVLARMDAASKDAAYDVITQPFGFRLMHTVLREYTLPAMARQGHLLRARLQTLKHALDGLTTGAGWIRHLEIATLEKMVEDLDPVEPSLPGRLEKNLAKFDAVARNPEYKMIAEREGFEAVRNALPRLINALQAEVNRQATPSAPDTAKTL